MNQDAPTSEPLAPDVQYVDWPVFLTDHPPGSSARIRGLSDGTVAEAPRLYVPELRLYCQKTSCSGEQTATASGSLTIFSPNKAGDPVSCSRLPESTLMAPPGVEWFEALLQYYCRTCREPLKLYAIRVSAGGEARPHGLAIKVGEFPPFAPRVPSRLITLIGPDRDLFLKGRAAEVRNLGIGAFSYYRRVVENQKNRLLDQIICAAKQRNAGQKVIDTLTKAKDETQFSKAVEGIKDAIPKALRIKEHNPLTLLHNALSKGLHANSDEECLNVAHHIRVILGELAENLSQILRDDHELDQAISHLLNAEGGRSTKES